MVMEATVPSSHRWIPKAMSVQHLEKAHHVAAGAQARLDPPDFTTISEGTELVVPVSVIDRSGTEVVHPRHHYLGDAGELTWRDRDVRASPFLHVAPVT